MRPLDTSPEAYAIQTAALRRLSGAERFKIAVEMSLLVRELARAGIRHDHPDWSDEEILAEIVRRQLPPGSRFPTSP